MKPCVFVGMGGTGAKLIRDLYKKVADKHGRDWQAGTAGQYYHMCVFDTDTRQANDLNINVEYFQLVAHPKKDLENMRLTLPDFSQWWPRDSAYAPNVAPGTGAGQEPLYTYLALCNFLTQHATTFNNWVTTVITRLGARSIQDYQVNTTLGVAYQLPIVFLGGICGGTGSGLLIHLPYLFRKVFGTQVAPMGAVNQRIAIYPMAVLYTPEASHLVRPLTGTMNAISYAAAMSLDYWQLPSANRPEYRMNYNVNLGNMRLDISDGDRPYEMVYWVGNRAGGREPFSKGADVENVTTDFLYGAFIGSNTASQYASMMSQEGNFCQKMAVHPSGVERPQSYGSFITARLQFPRRSVADFLVKYVAGRWRQRALDLEVDGVQAADFARLMFKQAGLDAGGDPTVLFAEGAALGLMNERARLRKIGASKTSKDLETNSQEYLADMERECQSRRQNLEDQGPDDLNKVRQKLSEQLGAYLKSAGGAHGVSPLGVVRSVPSNARALLKGLLGDVDVQEASGLYGRRRACENRIFMLKEEIKGICDVEHRDGIFTRKLTKACGKVVEDLNKIEGEYAQLLAVEAAIRLLEKVRDQWVEAVERAIGAFDKAISKHLVPRGYAYDATGLPPFNAGEIRCGIMQPVFYNINWIKERWLKGWRETEDMKVGGQTVAARYAGLSRTLLGTPNAPGPIATAMANLFAAAYADPDKSEDALAADMDAELVKARNTIRDMVAAPVEQLNVWEAIWLEAEQKAEAAKKEGKDSDALSEAKLLLTAFFDGLEPMWTRLQIGAVANVHAAEPNTLTAVVVGPDRSNLPQGHRLRNDIFTLPFRGNLDEVVAGGGATQGTAWSSFLLVFLTHHGWPLGRLFTFEQVRRPDYEHNEMSTGKRGTSYLHTDYKHRDDYHFLEFDPVDIPTSRLNRVLVVICEYIGAASKDSETVESKFMGGLLRDMKDDSGKVTGQRWVPSIIASGTNSYSVVVRNESASVHGREKLYGFFADKPDLREEIRVAVEDKWLKSADAPARMRIDVVKDIKEWASQRSLKASDAGSQLAPDFKQDAEVVGRWADTVVEELEKLLKKK